MKAKMNVGSFVEATRQGREDTVYVITAQDSGCSITTSFGDISVRTSIQGAEVVEPGTCVLPGRPLLALKALDPADELLLEASESGWRYSTGAGASCSNPTPWLTTSTESREIPDLLPLKEIRAQVWLEALKQVQGSNSILFRGGALLGVCRPGLVMVRSPDFTEFNFEIPHAAVAILLGRLRQQRSATLLGGEGAIGVALGPTTVTWAASPVVDHGIKVTGEKTSEGTVLRVLRMDFLKALQAIGKGCGEIKYDSQAAAMVIATGASRQTSPVRAMSGPDFHITVEAFWLLRHLREIRSTEVGLLYLDSVLRVIHAQELRDDTGIHFLESVLGTKAGVVESEVPS